MMLQAIHQNKRPARASSIYCHWIRSEQPENPSLVAVWIDSEMRGFEREFTSDSNVELLPEDALDDPGWATAPQTRRQAMITEIAAQFS
jgi:hypothetical protein